MTALYELIFVIRQGVAVSQVEELQKMCEDMIKKEGGTVENQEYCGLLTLAYPIGANKRAHYVLFDVKGPPGMLKPLDQKLRLTQDVIRHLAVRVDEFGERPSVLSKGKGQWGRSVPEPEALKKLRG